MRNHMAIILAKFFVLFLILTTFQSASFAGDQLSQIKKQGFILIGTEGTYPPYSFADSNGQLTGFDVDFAKLLAQHLGVKAKFVAVKFDSLLAALYAKRIDIIVNQIAITAERKQAKALSLSVPYLNSGTQALIKSDSPFMIEKITDLNNHSIGVGLGTNYEAWLRKNLPTADVRTYDDDPTKYRDLTIGRVDLILVDRLAASYLINHTGVKLKLAGPIFNPIQTAVAVRKEDTTLLQAINQAIATMNSDHSLTQLQQHWFGKDALQ